MRAVKLKEKKSLPTLPAKLPQIPAKLKKSLWRFPNGLFNVEVMKRSLRKAQSCWKSLKPLESENYYIDESFFVFFKEGPGIMKGTHDELSRNVMLRASVVALCDAA